MKKILYTIAAAMAIGGTVLATTAATASIIGDPATPEQAGYQLTGAQFAGIHGTVYLRNATQYAASVGGLGQSVQLWGGGKVYVLGLSNSTTSGPYSPAVAVFDATTHALICATANSTCPDVPASWLSGAANVPTGHTARLSAYYDHADGTIKFTVADVTAGTAHSFVYDAGLAISFTQARIGTEFGSDPWTAPTFHAPATQEKTAAFTSAGIVNYKGRSYPLTGYWTTAALSMTGAGSVTEADAGPLSAGGAAFSTFLEP